MKNSAHIYLFSNEQDVRWGLTVNTTGLQTVGVNEHYPPKNHPSQYIFSKERGRTLEEYQLLYLVRGGGVFTSRHISETGIAEGQMVMLFPGEWHSYYPEPSTGWDIYWIGFKGEDIDKRVRHGFFTRQAPIFNIGLHQEIVFLYQKAIQVASDQHTGFQQMLAGTVNNLVGYAYAYNKLSLFEDGWTIQQINKAKVILHEEMTNNISPKEIAAQLNMSYSCFRRMFKQYTGSSPSQYRLELRIQRSKELLTHTNLSSREISFQTGFENPDYFCTLFRKRTGMSPIRYREFTRNNARTF